MRNRRRKSNNKSFWYIVIAAFALIAILFVEIKTNHFPSSKSGKIVDQAPVPSTNPTPNTMNPSPTPSLSTPSLAPNSQDTSQIAQNLSMPIFMYHYIRVVDDPSDKIGIGLSVTPATFAAQLKTIKDKSYSTTTFRDINDNKTLKKPIVLTFDDGYEDFYQNAFPLLKQYGFKAVLFDITSKNGGEYLNNDQLKELDNYGIEIGSHTISHIDLSTAKAAASETQIDQSKQTLESLLGKPVVSFCYPSGKYTSETINQVKSAGYKYATTTKSGVGKFDTPFELSRYRIEEGTNISKFLN